jgi:anti-sigma B factor antagonist
MTFDFKEKGGVLVITMEGKMIGGPDATHLSQKLHELIEKGQKRFVVNMDKVDWMNSSGLGILIGGLTTVRNHGGDFKLCRLGKKPRELLEITKLDRVFSIHDQEEEAIVDFSSK